MKPKNYPEPVVGGFVMNRKGQVLMVKSPRWKEGWVIPGGHVEFGEAMTDALRREIMEEVGLRVKVTRLVAIQQAILPKNFRSRKHFIFFDFLCQAQSDKVRMDRDEVHDYRWVKPRDALKLKVDKYIRHSLSIVANAEFPSSELERKILSE